MTLWQDQTPRQPGAGVADGPARDIDPNRPLSRRELRERERRAAEALAAGHEHPSGVVDFGAHDFDPALAADQGFGTQDTADIWAALAEQSQRQSPSAPPAPAPAADAGLPPVTDDLMGRVRDAMLHRERPQHDGPAATPPAAQDSRRSRRRGEPVADDRGAGARFSDPQGLRAAPGFDDLPPTVAMRMPAADPAAPTALPAFGAPFQFGGAAGAPAGNDALAFSSPVPIVEPDPIAHPATSAVAAFIQPEQAVEPEQHWAQRHQAWSAEPEQQQWPEQQWPEQQWGAADVSPGLADDEWADDDEQWNEPTAVHGTLLPPAPAPAAAAVGQDAHPYSEPTDLAGFEALIKQARGRTAGSPLPLPLPPPQASAAAPAPTAWQEPDEDEPSAFVRAVAAPHGASNALVLPEDPTPDLTQAVNSTGDIFITGSMKLPRSLSTTGATEEHYDGPDVDRLFEAAHNEPAAGVAPVRASRAIAGTPSGRSFVGRRSRSNVLPTVLAVVAGAMAVGVLVLLVGSWVLKLF